MASRPQTPGPGTQAAPVAERTSNERLDSKPPNFDGSSKNAKHFILRLQNYFAANPSKFPVGTAGSRQKVLTAISFMKEGVAKHWADDIIEKAFKTGTSEHPDYPGWDEFEAQFRSTFEDQNRVLKAREDIQRLVQGRTSANEYILAFDQLRVQTGFDEVALIEMFKNGLRWELVERILWKEEKDQPKDLEGWQRNARAFESLFRIKDEEKTRHGGHAKPLYPTVGLKPKFESQQQYVPMDVDAFQSNPTKPKPLTVEERADCVKRGACFRCRKEGHMSRDCPIYKGTSFTKKKTTKYKIRAADDDEEERLLYKIIKATSQLTEEERDVVKASLYPKSGQGF